MATKRTTKRTTKGRHPGRALEALLERAPREAETARRLLRTLRRFSSGDALRLRDPAARPQPPQPRRNHAAARPCPTVHFPPTVTPRKCTRVPYRAHPPASLRSWGSRVRIAPGSPRAAFAISERLRPLASPARRYVDPEFEVDLASGTHKVHFFHGSRRVATKNRSGLGLPGNPGPEMRSVS